MTNVETTQDRRPVAGEQTDRHDPVPMAVDWLIGLLTGLFGLGLVGGGGILFAEADRESIAEAVAEDDVDIGRLTESEVTTAAVEFTDWMAAGLVLTGLAAVVAAGAFVVARRRTRRRVAREGGTTATFWACAVYGAGTSVVVSFIPGSVLVGGGAAAYLHDGDASVRAGAAAGLVGIAVTVPVVLSVAAGFVAGGVAVGALSGGAGIATLLLVAELLLVVVTVGLSALGGFLADRFV